MNWDKLLVPYDERFLNGERVNQDPGRSRFERDYDRILYSSAFRRLQMKTQVYPLPGYTMVHNRLTHTLEVASVGRSLANLLTKYLFEKEQEFVNAYPNSLDGPQELKQLCSANLQVDLAAIVSSACLAHDLGNPPFGHFGESAISDFVKSRFLAQTEISDESFLEPNDYKSIENIFSDFSNFDGNANSLRLLINGKRGEHKLGFEISYPTLSSIIKYPWGANDATTSPIGRKNKYGFFDPEKTAFLDIVQKLNIQSNNNIHFGRHPLVHLVETADDICNMVIDLQDGHHLRLISESDYYELWRPLLNMYSQREYEKIAKSFLDLKRVDTREAVNSLRSYIVSKLLELSFNCFKTNYSEIMAGSYTNSLIKGIQEISGLRDEIKRINENKLFSYHKVLQLEIAGFGVINTLLEYYYDALETQFSNEKALNNRQSHLLRTLPNQYSKPTSKYEALLFAIDFVSNMTDEYAIDLTRKLTGTKSPILD